MTARRMYNIIATQKKTLQDLRKMEVLPLELCAKNASRFRLFAEIVRQVCAKKGERRRGEIVEWAVVVLLPGLRPEAAQTCPRCRL